MAAHRNTAFREQKMLEQAKKSILDSGDFLTLDQIAQRLGLPLMTLIAALYEWETEGHIFSIQHAGCSLFPAYVLQDGTEYGLIPDLKTILDVLRAKKDGWGIAFWFASSNGYIGNRRPQDLLCSDADKVLRAARDEVSGITHG